MLGQSFELVSLDYPYIETPYSRYDEDIISISKAMNQKANGVPIDVPSLSFPGAMMNAMWKYVP